MHRLYGDRYLGLWPRWAAWSLAFLDVIGEVVDRRPIHFIQPAQINELIDWKSMANTRSSVSRLPLVGRVRLEQTPDEKFSPIGN